MVKLTFLSAASAGLYVVLAFASELPPARRLFPELNDQPLFEASLEFWAIWIALFVLYAAAVRVARARESRATVMLIFATSALFRGVLFFGHGFDHGNAFTQVPNPLGAWFPVMWSDFDSQRLVATLCDLVALSLTPAMLRSARLPAALLILHGWNPLVIKEAAGSGRSDFVALLLLMLALRLAQRDVRFGAALAYGTSLSGPPLLLGSLPVMARALRFQVAVALAVAAGCWHFAFAGTDWLTRLFSEPPESLGSSLSPCLNTIFRLMITRDAVWPTLVGLLLWSGLAVTRVVRASDKTVWPRELLLLLAGLVFLSPRVVPAAFVIFAYLGLFSVNPGWIVFTATAPVTYAAAGLGGWNFWLGFAQYFGPYALLIFFWLGSPPRHAAG